MEKWWEKARKKGKLWTLSGEICYNDVRCINRRSVYARGGSRAIPSKQQRRRLPAPREKRGLFVGKRRFGDRRDARWLREMDGLHAVMPHLMPKRTDAEVYLCARMDVTEALAYIQEKNRGEEEYRATLFHCFLMAVAKTIYLRPALNRFVAGRRYYQRDEITLGFVAKRRFEDHSEETLICATAPEDWTLTDVTRRVVGKVHTARQQKEAGLDGLLNAAGRMPRPLLALVAWGFRTLDFFGKAPRAITQGDPNYTTVFLSNLGSIQCPAVYHHLNNYGTNSIMITIGTIRKEHVLDEAGAPALRDVVDVGITLDERIADGFYFGRSWKIVQYLLSNPTLLDRPLKEEIEFEC